MKAELSKVAQEKEDLEERHRHLKEILERKKAEVQRLSSGEGVSRRQADEATQKHIEALEEALLEQEEKSNTLQKQLFV